MFEFYTVKEVAGILRSSKMTIYRLIESGELPATRPSPGKYLIPADGLKQFIDTKTAVAGDDE